MDSRSLTGQMAHVHHRRVRGDGSGVAQCFVLLLVGLSTALSLFHGDIGGGPSMDLMEASFAD